jgi:DNA-binding CsgD family transcriptional regulator
VGLPWNCSLIEAAFADAAMDPSRWPAAMDIIAAATESIEANLLPIASDPGGGGYGAPPKVSFKANRAGSDLRKKAAPKRAREQTISDDEMATPGGMALGPYRNDLRARQGLRWFGSVNITAGNDIWCLLLHRSYAQKAFSRAELAQLRRLSGPLSSTATLARLFNFVRAEGALAAFEFNGHAAALVDRNAEILRMNDACKRLFGRNFVIRKGRIFARDQGSRLKLENAIQRLLHSKEAAVPPVALPCTGSERPLLAYAIRLSKLSHDFFSDCAAILVFVDLDAPIQPPERVLRECFGLSGAEARLASGLASGKSLEELAPDLSISKQTARYQLKSTFSKLNVHRQAELTALLGKLLRI